jgi:hypothetical protein
MTTTQYIPSDFKEFLINEERQCIVKLYTTNTVMYHININDDIFFRITVDDNTIRFIGLDTDPKINRYNPIDIDLSTIVKFLTLQYSNMVQSLAQSHNYNNRYKDIKSLKTVLEYTLFCV